MSKITDSVRERTDSPAPRAAAVRRRVPMAAPQLKLGLPLIQGYTCRWFNDEPGRIERASSAGYEFVSPAEAPGFGEHEVTPGNSDLGSRISRVVGTPDSGPGPLRAFLLKIRTDWYMEDQAAKQAEVDKLDEAIRSGSIGPNVDPRQRYVKDVNLQS